MSSRIDRLAVRIAKRPPIPVTVRTASGVHGHGRLSRRALLSGGFTAGLLALVPLRLVSPDFAQADGYCAAQCLDDAATGYNARYTKCFLSAFGTDIPDKQALATYVAAKIRSGGLGALVVANEVARADACMVGNQIRYHIDAGRCGDPHCGDAGKYPPPPGCETCEEFCCFCPTGVVAAGCLPAGSASNCDRSCAACQQSKAGGFPVYGVC
jgi:hypothetical protein